MDVWCIAAARCCLLAVVAAAPWAFGGVDPWAQRILYSGLLAALACYLPTIFLKRTIRSPQTALVLPVALIPWLGALVLAAVQLLPMDELASQRLERIGRPDGRTGSQLDRKNGELRPVADAASVGRNADRIHPVATIRPAGAAFVAGADAGSIRHDGNRRFRGQSPNDIPARAQPLESNRDSLRSEIAWSTLSFYPASTRLEIARLTAGLTAFLLGALLFRTRQAQAWLWGVLSLNGAALAFFGIAQQLSWNEKLYWTFPLRYGGHPFASFVNRNNAAGYLNLCLAGSIGFLVWVLYRRSLGAGGTSGFRGGPPRSQSTSRPRAEHRPNATIRRRLARALAQLSAAHVAVCSLPVLIVAGVISANSRGGILAMVLAGAAVMLAFMRIRPARAVPCLFVLVLVLSLLLAGWLGTSADAAARLASLADPQIASDSRLAHWRDALQAFADFPLLGTGWGTYRYAYQPYQSHPSGWFYNADNQYVELLVETGTAGLLLVLAGVALFVLPVGLLIRASRSVPDDAAGFVGLFVLISQGLHALVDFGILVPSNLLCCALIGGAVSGRAALLVSSRSLRGGAETAGAEGSARGRTQRFVMRLIALPELRPPLLAALAFAALLINGGLGVREMATAAAARAALRDMPSLSSQTAADLGALDSWIERSTRSAARRPDDAELQMALAEAWIHRYRLHTFELLRRQTGVSEQYAEHALWQLTDVAVLHRRANQLHQAGRWDTLRALQADARIVQNLLPAVAHLSAAQAACPLVPDCNLTLAQLAFLIDPAQVSGESHLRQSAKLFPGDPEHLYRVGLIAYSAELHDLAQTVWRRSLELSADRKRDIAKLLEVGIEE